jgi:hypothetical protein
VYTGSSKLTKGYVRKLSALNIPLNAVAPAAIETSNAEMPDGTVELSTIHAYMSSVPGASDKIWCVSTEIIESHMHIAVPIQKGPFRT